MEALGGFTKVAIFFPVFRSLMQFRSGFARVKVFPFRKKRTRARFINRKSALGKQQSSCLLFDKKTRKNGTRLFYQWRTYLWVDSPSFLPFSLLGAWNLFLRRHIWFPSKVEIFCDFGLKTPFQHLMSVFFYNGAGIKIVSVAVKSFRIDVFKSFAFPIVILLKTSFPNPKIDFLKAPILNWGPFLHFGVFNSATVTFYLFRCQYWSTKLISDF